MTHDTIFANHTMQTKSEYCVHHHDNRTFDFELIGNPENLTFKLIFSNFHRHRPVLV